VSWLGNSGDGGGTELAAGGDLDDCGDWGGMAASENRTRLRPWWTMMAHARRYVVKGIVVAAFVSSLRLC
jgi:hypothetical protein